MVPPVLTELIGSGAADSQELVLIDDWLYDKATDGKTNRTHFREMLNLAKSRENNPSTVDKRLVFEFR